MSEIENGRHASCEAHFEHATASPATGHVKPNELVPGSPIPIGRQSRCEAQIVTATASPATDTAKPTGSVPGSPLESVATLLLKPDRDMRPEPGHLTREAHCPPAGLTHNETVAHDVMKPMLNMRPEPGHSSRENRREVAGLTNPIGRQSTNEPQSQNATESPAIVGVKPNELLPGSPIGRQCSTDAPSSIATASPARIGLKSNDVVPGSSSQRNGRQKAREAPSRCATASPANGLVKPMGCLPGSPLETVATKDMKSLRPEPGQLEYDIQKTLAGLTLSSVAISPLKPTATVRPEPGQGPHDVSIGTLPGSLQNGRQSVCEALFSVATEPGPDCRELHKISAGLTSSNTVARVGLKSTAAMRPSEPGHSNREAHLWVAGLTLQENGRQPRHEALRSIATAEPGPSSAEAHDLRAGLTSLEMVATDRLKPRNRVRPSPAAARLKPKILVPGSSHHRRGRHSDLEAQSMSATAEPGHGSYETPSIVAGLTNSGRNINGY